MSSDSSLRLTFMSRKKEGMGRWAGRLNLNQKKKAIALMYDRVRAPVVNAKGEGALADEIIS